MIKERKGGPKRRIFKIDELKLDMEFYPRMEIGWQTAYQYSQAMRVGDIFPPILVGEFEGGFHVVDGWHRIRAKELLKEEHIEGIVKNYDSYADMFFDAIKQNISHGRQLSTQEKVRIVYKLEKMNVELDRITEIVKIPSDKIELFRSRVVIGPDGKPVFLKSVVARAGADEMAALRVDMGRLSTRRISDLLEQLIELLESGVFQVDGETKELAVHLYGLLGRALHLSSKAL